MPSASVEQLLRAVASGPVATYGVNRPFAAHLAAELAELSTQPIVMVTADEATAAQLTVDCRFFLAPSTTDDPAAAPPVLHLPGLDSSPYAELSPDRRALMARMTGLFRLSHAMASRVVILSARALLRKSIAPAELGALADLLEVEQEIDRDGTAELLVRAGYARVPVVEDPGTFAVRGGVMDIFAPLYRYPVRIELFGDLVETMRFFDPQSQRTLRDLSELYLHPVRETIRTGDADPRTRILEAADAAAHPSAQTRRVLESVERGEEFVGIETLTPAFHAQLTPVSEYLPRHRWLLLDPDAILGAATDELDEAERRYRERIADHRIAFPPTDHFLSRAELEATLVSCEHRVEARSLEFHTPQPQQTPSLRFVVDSNLPLRAEMERARRQKADELMAPLVAAFGQWCADGWRIGIACDDLRRTEQLAGLLREYGVELQRQPSCDLTELQPAAPTILPGHLTDGFAVPAEQLVVITDDDIFGERIRTSSRQRAAARRAKQALLGGVADFSELSPGDHLVHQLHGVGVYKGLAKLPLRGTPLDFLQLEYDGGQLYLPVYRLNEVQRYVGVEGRKPRLDKLGGVTWDKTRKKVSKDIRKLAEELLQLYAQRQALSGHAFPPADAMYQEFEATFPFQETPDQQKAIDDVAHSMEQPRPMDRLVCGDVGYGKTEVAVRAALKAVLGGKQVAVLAPTTVLVEQHFLSFQARFGGWPVTVERLSRFRSRADQTQVVRRLAEGKLDVVIGTHRILSKDIRFKDLGLIVIDEEQRFGVAHKERLKKLRTQVDVLTLTATPIPRTLHMALVGMRDLSIIATPPADRRAVRTLISRPDDGVLREGIRRELTRGGQVFFVCPRIGGELRPGKRRTTEQQRRPPHFADRSLYEWASHLGQLAPEARIAVAHGQMDSEELEQVMVRFVDGEHDILVSTTIIENGLDIARANTMFVDRADAFGLSQLYQLRGRVGRSKERAYCYLLTPAAERLTDDARRRLEALQRFSELGAGFSIASQDLEIRGAGDLLGARQSGSISAVGFEQYTAILEEAVAELRGEPISRAADPELNVEVPGFIPEEYVPDTGQRLDLYKRLASAADEQEVVATLEEITDRYGAAPMEVELLGELMILKVHARRLGALSLDLTATRLSLALGSETPLDPARVLGLVNQPKSPYRLTPDLRLQRHFSATERDAPMPAARSCLLDLLAHAT